MRTARIEAFLRFHTGAPLVDSPGEADYAFVASPAELPALESFEWGTDELPEGSTSVILQVERLEPWGGWRLQGPGIDGIARLEAGGLPASFVPAWRDVHAAFPRGIDLFLACGATFCGLPRTTRVEE